MIIIDEVENLPDLGIFDQAVEEVTRNKGVAQEEEGFFLDDEEPVPVYVVNLNQYYAKYPHRNRRNVNDS